MCARPAFAPWDSPSRRHLQRLRFSRSGKHVDVDMKDMKVALDIIFRPSLQLWSSTIGRGVLSALKRPPKPLVLSDGASSTSSASLKKKVRFDEQPVTISRKGFFERFRRDSSSSLPRPCLVTREQEDISVPPKTPDPLVKTDTDSASVYEDCLSDYPGFLVDVHAVDGDDRSGTLSRKNFRRSEFYEVESGIAMFDRAGYANYCLSKWLDKQREDARVPKNRMFEGPLLLPSHTLSPPPPMLCSQTYPNMAPSAPPLPTLASRQPRSLSMRILRYFEDELQNALFVLVVGLFIHICLFLFLLYDILTRGLIPSDD